MILRLSIGAMLALTTALPAAAEMNFNRIAAFAVGVTVTMICIRLKNKSKDRTVSTEERED